MLSSGLEKHQ
ncbi:unnamed protein product, partial [Didymodactylos carnosus]